MGKCLVKRKKKNTRTTYGLSTGFSIVTLKSYLCTGFFVNLLSEQKCVHINNNEAIKIAEICSDWTK